MSMEDIAVTIRNCWLVGVLLCCSLAHAAAPISINGVDTAVAENIRLHLPAVSELKGLGEAALQKRLLQPTTRALQALGYYEATIRVTMRDDVPTLQIDPGAVVSWGEAQVMIDAGDAPVLPQLTAFVHNHPFTPGQPINHGIYDKYKRDLLALAQRSGYLEAALQNHRLSIDLTRGRADVTLKLVTGRVYHIAAIDYDGSDLSLGLLQRLTKLTIGERYDATSIGEVYNRLLNTGYFTSVTVDSLPQPPDRVGLRIELQDAVANRFSAGAGYGTDTGPRLKFGWQRPWINPRGDSLQSQLELSSISRALTLEYRIPWHHPLERYLNWQSGWREKDLEDTYSKILTTGIAYHKVTDSGWQYSYQLDLEQETFRQGSQPQQTETYLVPGSNWSRTFLRGEPRQPDWGFRFWFGISASNKELGSSTDFIRLTAGGRLIKKLGDNYQLIARASGGALYSGEFTDVPSSRRFFTGGDQTVRGFDFESLSPRDDAGELTGGQYLNTASLELRRRWRPNWQWAVFTDTGRAYNHGSDPFHTGAGVGVRWQSPFGDVILDVAKPIDSDSSDSVQLHIYMGLPL